MEVGLNLFAQIRRYEMSVDLLDVIEVRAREGFTVSVGSRLAVSCHPLVRFPPLRLRLPGQAGSVEMLLQWHPHVWIQYTAEHEHIPGKLHVKVGAAACSEVHACFAMVPCSVTCFGQAGCQRGTGACVHTGPN